MSEPGETDALPFENVALSLSGGGARAVGYHLGTLDYLHRLGLLRKVHILSTVSGGTLVGASYALAVEEGTSFQDLFCDFFEFFPNVNMFEGLLEIINRKSAPVESGTRNFATAFAEMYHEDFFSRYFERPYFATVKSFEDVIFNATEFTTGTAFRFQKSGKPCKVGNGNIWMDAEQANELRIADIVSASSCVPGGFEPFRFPEDFHWPRTYRHGERQGETFGPVELQTNERPISGLALMDGGVYDNQGITSVLLAISRRVSDSQTPIEMSEHRDPRSWAKWAHGLLENFSIVDLFIISDTPVLKDTMYAGNGRSAEPASRFAQWLGRRTLGSVNRFAWIVTITLLLSSVASFARLVQTGQLAELRRHLAQGVSGYLPVLYEALATLVPLLTAGLLGAVVWLLHSRLDHAVQSMQSSLPRFEHPPWHYLRQLRISDLASMLKLRASSLMALSSDIYMHRIRQLGYGILFSRRELIPTVMTNEIYAVRSGHETELPGVPVSEQVGAIVELASTMATKSSFDSLSRPEVKQNIEAVPDAIDRTRLTQRENGESRSDLDLLVACGQISTCYNLMRYVRRKLQDLDDRDRSVAAVEELLERAGKDWARLQESPFMYVDERLARGRSPEHANKLARIAGRKSGTKGRQ